MSLPPGFTSTEEYLNSALHFLKKHQWLYNYNNTHILVAEVFSNFPPEWKTHFKSCISSDLHNMALGQIEESAPTKLKLLVKDIAKLKPQVSYNSFESQEHYQCFGLSRKKYHEIVSLAPVIYEVCQTIKCDLIIDVGAGLGYLSHLLYEKYGYPVLGLEASKEFIKLAYKNQEKYYPQAKNFVKFCELYIDENSRSDIEKLIMENFSDSQNICIAGLHACADLSLTILNLFTHISNARVLCVMPCCYHRIKVECEDEEKTHCKNFPSSKLLTRLFNAFDAQCFLRKPFLRLACQQTIASFTRLSEEEHKQHSRQCMYRAILQLVAGLENCTVRRLKRKSGKLNATDNDEGFYAYVNNLKNTHKLEYGETSPKNQVEITDEAFSSKMHEKWNEFKGDCCLVEVLTGLQAAIQSICENVILLDRVEFLREKGFQCNVKKITNDFISPRCFALIASKPL